MAKMFDKISLDFMNAIKGVLEAKAVNKHGHDVVGKEDDDIDNDGDVDKSDKYLHNRRKAIGKAMMKKEEAEQIDEATAKIVAHLQKRYGDNIRKSHVRSAAGDFGVGYTGLAHAVRKKLGVTRLAEDEQIDEISTDLALNYMDKASDARGHKNMSTAKQDKRYKSVALAHKKIAGRGVTVPTNEEADQIDELSKKTMGSYINKAKDSIDITSYRSGIKDGTAISSSTPYKSNNPLEKKLTKRHKGIETAVSKLTKEESEQIDELSKKTLGSYVKKAADSTRTNARWAARTGDRDAEYIVDKRRKGIEKAADKLTKEEIEMIEAKMAGVAPGSMDGDKHMCATKVFHKEWNEGTPIKTMHADPDADGLIEWYDVMFDHGIERVMTEDMEVLQAESHMHSKKKMKEEAGYLETDLKKRKVNNDKAIKDMKKMGSPMRNPHFGEEVEELDELSKNTMLRYVSANKKETKAAEDKGDYGKSVQRMRGTDMAVRKYTAKPGSKYVRVPATEEVELDEARGRPKKAGQMDYTVHPITKEKLMHNNPAHMKKIELLQKNKVLEKPKTEANQHIINQLQKAKLSMQGGSTIQFTHGQAKHVSGTHAAKLLTKYAGMKPDEKEAFQKKIGHSHEQLMKHV